MSGVKVIRYILANDAPVVAVVPVSRIMAGDLPINTTLPAIMIEQISSIPRLTLRMTEPNRMHTDRVQVSAVVKGPQGNPQGDGYGGVKSLMALILTACPNQRGTVNGVIVDSILPDDEGPDQQDDATAVYSGSRDFLVRWKSAT